MKPSTSFGGFVMGKFLTTNKTRPCPVCAKTNGNCRIMPDDGVLCMTFPDGENSPDYRYSKATANGIWGVYYPRRDNDFDPIAYEAKKQAREARERELERQRREKCLSPEQRNREYQRLFAELALSDGDRLNLLRRGFTEAEIKAGGYVSAEKFQRLRGEYHANLPGIGKYGNSLANGQPGFIVPVRNAFGQIVAYQLRDKEGHKWSKGAKMPNGEQPMGVAYPAIASGPANTVGTGEGFLKIQRAAHLVGMPFIGAAGGLFSPKETKQALEDVQQVQGWAEKPRITDYPDAGWKSNPHVARTTYRRVKLMESLGYAVIMADWGQGYDKAVGDIDELTPEQIAAIKLVSPKEAFASIPGLLSPIERFGDWLTQQTKRLKPKGFGAVRPEGEEFTGDRSQAWLDAISRGNAVLDASLMGSGKSFNIPELRNPQGKIWYFYLDHRNPTIEAIANDFVDLYPRNQYGFYRDNKGKLRKATADTPEEIKVVKGNCVRADLFPMLTDKGYDPNDGGGSNPICASCPMANVCAHTAGWYRADRRAILNNADRIRCSIESAPRDWDYSKDLIAVDEPAQQLQPTKTIDYTWEELLAESYRYRETLNPDQWEALDRLLVDIGKLFPESPRYGFRHDELLEKLAHHSGEGLRGATEAIAANPLDLTDLFPKAERETTKDNLSPAERKKWAAGIKALNAFESGKAYRESEENLEGLTPNALSYLLAGITGQPGISLRIKKTGGSLTIDRRGEYAFLNRAKGLIFLDATAQGSNLTAIAGINRPLEVIRSEMPPLTNLTVRQIEVAGIGSKDISPTAIGRVETLLGSLGNVPIIGPKGWRDKFGCFAGHWFVDSRGSNAFAGNPRLAFLGLPQPNVGTLEDEYLAIHSNLEGFEEYYNRRVNAEILQGAGRQRAHRFPDRQFEAIFICPPNTDLSWLSEYGITVSKTNAFLIDAKAGTESQLAKAELLGAIHDLMGQGLKVTQQAIAAKLGKSQQAISKLLSNAGVKLPKLLQNMASSLRPRNTTPPYKSTIRTGCILPAEIYKEFAWFLEIDATTLAMELLEMISLGGWEGLTQWLETLPIAVRVRILGILYGLVAMAPTSAPRISQRASA
jgi:hypothetical protein